MITTDPLSPGGVDRDAVLAQTGFEARLHDLETLMHQVIEARSLRSSAAKDFHLTEEALDYYRAQLVAEGKVEGSNAEKRQHALKLLESSDANLRALVEQRDKRRDALADTEDLLKATEFHYDTARRQLRAIEALFYFLSPNRP